MVVTVVMRHTRDMRIAMAAVTHISPGTCSMAVAVVVREAVVVRDVVVVMVRESMVLERMGMRVMRVGLIVCVGVIGQVLSLRVSVSEVPIIIIKRSCVSVQHCL